MTGRQELVLEVTGTAMLNLNSKAYRDRHERAVRVKILRSLARFKAASLHRYRADERVRITVTLQHATSAPKRDVGNWSPTAKAIVDGIVDAGILVDDDDEHVEGPDLRPGPPAPDATRAVPNQYKRNRVTVTLEPLVKPAASA